MAARARALTPAGELVAQARAHAGDELERLTTAAARLADLTQAVGLPDTLDAVVDALAGRLADDAVSDTISEHKNLMVDAITEHNNRANQARVYAHAQGIIRSRIAETTRQTADPALRWLHTQLRDLLGRVDTGDSSLVVQQYREIRKAQKVLTADARGRHDNGTDIHCGGTTRTPTDENYQAAVGLTIERTGMNGQRVGYEPEPWPAPIYGADDPIPSSDPVAYLRWLADRGDAWVPTSSELGDALRVRQRAIRNGVPIDQLDDTEHRSPGRVTISYGGSDLHRDLARRQHARVNGEWP